MTAISAKIIDGASLLISSVRSRLNSDGELKDKELVAKLSNVIPALEDAIQNKKNIL